MTSYQILLPIVIILYSKNLCRLTNGMKISSFDIINFCQNNDWKQLTFVTKRRNSLRRDDAILKKHNFAIIREYVLLLALFKG